jgi:nuclear transport factor 2 (NTF2) superfamily protein
MVQSEGAMVSHGERSERLRALYQAFNDRDLEAVVAAMAPDVDWPNGWEGGRLVGREEVRRYWERQWGDVRPTTIVTKVSERADATVAVRVRQVFRDPNGAVLARSDVVHVFEFEGPLVKRMVVEQ